MPTAIPNTIKKEPEAQEVFNNKSHNNNFTNNENYTPMKEPQLMDPNNNTQSYNAYKGKFSPLRQYQNEQQLDYNAQAPPNQEENMTNQAMKAQMNNMPFLPSNTSNEHTITRRASLGMYPPMPNNQMDLVTTINDVPSILSKANVVFEGNFQDILENWSDEEKLSKRRLVQFWRRHENNTIYCSFQPILPNARPPNSVIISCIYWEERMEYFITSVDCIHLLESLISVRFTVEEKNRIRRNLEGFRPLTVSKCKKETADFFKLIMAFPNPKPRNIEKDVKVFHWRVLPFALKKIVSKYASGYAPASNMPMDNFGSMQVKNNASLGYNPYYNSNPSSNYGGYQRRYSQPANLVNLNMFGQNYKLVQSGQQAANAYFNQNQPISQSYQQQTNFSMNNPSMPSISERPSYEDFASQFVYANQNQSFQRRHSLADPYSAHQSKPRNMNPLARLNEETMFNSNISRPNNGNMDALRHPSGLGIVEGRMELNKENNDFNGNNH
ncbi:hypothetical protein K502DRAFT_325001 [Neoconidiobolus thromboides FSU 785]|nr:hypothetical protein K502DRAFT_325001 [Neoconidiobolus thromboides FSU 785]